VRLIPRLGMLILILGTASCATSEEVRLRMRVAELEKIVVNQQDDMGYLMRDNFKLVLHIQQLEAGMVIQAEMMAKARENCEL
jgi:hypothetical protein